MSPSSYQPLSSECDHSVTLRDWVRHTKFLKAKCSALQAAERVVFDGDHGLVLQSPLCFIR